MPAYSRAVRQYFTLPPRPPGVTASGEAGSRAQGVWIRFGADLAAGRIANPGFRAFACPHIIAACQRAAELLDGAPVKAMTVLTPEELQQEFEIPVEKTGKLLILMDALSACADELAAAEDTGL